MTDLFMIASFLIGAAVILIGGIIVFFFFISNFVGGLDLLIEDIKKELKK